MGIFFFLFISLKMQKYKLLLFMQVVQLFRFTHSKQSSITHSTHFRFVDKVNISAN